MVLYQKILGSQKTGVCNFKQLISLLIISFLYFKKLFIQLIKNLLVRYFYKKAPHLPRLWWGAYKILTRLKSNNAKSRYSHCNILDADRGVYDLNCYGFVNRLLFSEQLVQSFKEVQDYINASKDIPAPKDGQPCPLHYVSFIKSAANKKHWLPLREVCSVEPGDIIAYTIKPPNNHHNPLMSSLSVLNSYKNIKPESGQHIMIVAGNILPMQEKQGFWIPVFDSTQHRHGHFDIRGSEGGVGQGVIGLECNEHGAPDKIMWSTTGRSLNRDIVMARPLVS